ncbi:MAG: ATP-dependent DNA helicase [Rhodocyclaceae bacterium]|nr:ATP-dependent DNA helicase [Rhodocyclaceae bacterium]MCP5231538.1 ATP-dependent DNA helicase [Zoogloeaceae bacterium]MCP5254749.1 ATP-dependent DNA helicase [Zoogloeaceae bacterium]MCP5294381.1 ATP-dependent DNA helicase [Zoogloeaceae bacterium]MCW5613477.1 ATP-dependent DNA helicase [Rhodocyclaceae bacterium]
MSNLADHFSERGSLARAIPGFSARPQQVEMAARIGDALREHRVLVAEAGTGTGKTFAYLVPALLAGGKLIISTGTKTLQDQLFNRDLPTVRAALKVPVDVALLKGRANYVCPYHLERNGREGRFQSPQDAADLRLIARFAEITQSGDKAECPEVPEDSAAWLSATSTRDNCLGQECQYYKDDCFVLKARKRAMEADVVVVNHHLFFADVMLRDEGMGELLPAANAVIFDEAHQLPETASLFFGENVTTSQLLDLARDTRSETVAAARDFVALIDATRALEKAARDLRLAVKAENARFGYTQMLGNDEFMAALEALGGELDKFHQLVESQAERSEGLANCLRRTQEIQERLVTWRAPEAPEVVRWVEVFTQSLALNATPLHVSDVFRRQMGNQPKAWIFTSATLAVGSDFTHYLNEMGLSDLDPPTETAVWGSPFDYGEQAMLFAPQGMPNPNSPDYPERVAEVAFPLIRAAQGRTFVLCTSLRAMRRIHELLAERIAREGLALPILLQGEGSRSELLARFRRLGNAVLVASQSFWEGVDVPGDALSVVVIDKLPFAPPDDPVLAARVDYLEKKGLNPFFVYQLPRTVINMKQGAGRLIRTEQDRGVLCICDPRMIDKPYGKRVWRSLPPMRRSRVTEEVVDFLASLPAPASPTKG